MAAHADSQLSVAVVLSLGSALLASTFSRFLVAKCAVLVVLVLAAFVAEDRGHETRVVGLATYTALHVAVVSGAFAVHATAPEIIGEITALLLALVAVSLATVVETRHTSLTSGLHFHLIEHVAVLSVCWYTILLVFAVVAYNSA
jgi:hypothetical protein